MLRSFLSSVGLRGRMVAGLAAGMMVISAPAGAQTVVPRQVTFSKDIAPILQRSCQRCHRPGSVAPMSLLTYNDARPYARAMKQRTALRDAPWGRGAMPPWFLEKNIGIQKFKDDVSLSDAEIAMFAAWADGGAPEGNPADLPPPLQFAGNAEWTLGKPDLIVSSPTVFVPALASDWTDTLGPVPTGLAEARYVSSVEYMEVPETDRHAEAVGTLGGRFVFHHASLRVVGNEVSEEAARNGDGGFGTPHEVGRNGVIFPPDAGRQLPAHAGIIFNTHMHANGKDQRARMDVGLRLHPKGYEPKYQIARMRLRTDQLEISPNESDQRSDAYWVAPQPIKLLNYEPHMHAAGVRMCIEAIFGQVDQVVETLNCAGYDHNWVRDYLYDDNVTPLLPKGTILHAIAWFDNTAKNKNVLNPKNLTRFGFTSVGNMFIVFNEVVYLTDEQYQEELTKRRAYLRLKGEEEAIGCPDCATQSAPPNYRLPAPTAPTAATGLR